MSTLVSDAPRLSVGLRLRVRASRVAIATLRWAAILVPVFLLATFITFLLGVISGIDPVYVRLGENPTQAQADELTRMLRLDDPFLIQYWRWLSGTFQGDFGHSWVSLTPVGDVILRRAAISLSIAVLALVIGVVGGALLGILAVKFHQTWVDRSITFFTTVMAVMPAFIMGIALILIFCVWFPLLPSAGYIEPREGVGLWLSHAILPAIALSLDMIADVARQLRTSILGTRNENYLLGAQLNGYSGTRLLWGYSIRNSAGPALTLVGLKLPSLLGGAVITESIFGIAGMGKYAAESALSGDVPAVQGVLVISIAAVVFFNFLVNSVLNVLTPSGQRGA